ncbi:MAG: ABC transporter permease subunit [Actinomycetota bacterium]|nr:ABC transporter permease subunit [Actinomycetota bacterium]
MGFWSGLWAFFTTAANWSGPDGIWARLVVQVELSALVVAVAAVVGIGIGFTLGHFGRGGVVALNASNAARAIPSLALLTLLAIWPVVGLRNGGEAAAALTLIALALPPILTNAYVGMREVSPDVREAARASGMTRWQRLWRAEVPLALPLAVAGLRTAAVEVVATSTLAAYVTVNDLGEYIFAGLSTQNSVETVAGAILVALLSLLADLAVLGLSRLVIPEPLRNQGLSRPGKSTPGALVGSTG